MRWRGPLEHRTAGHQPSEKPWRDERGQVAGREPEPWSYCEVQFIFYHVQEHSDQFTEVYIYIYFIHGSASPGVQYVQTLDVRIVPKGNLTAVLPTTSLLGT